MPPKARRANDVEVDVEQLRALEARRTKQDANEPPFLYRPGMPQDPRSLAALQRSAGNAAVATMIRSRRPAARPLAVQRFNPGGARPAPQFPGMGKSPAEQLGGGGAGAGGAAGPALGAGEESVFIGGRGPKPKPGKV